MAQKLSQPFWEHRTAQEILTWLADQRDAFQKMGNASDTSNVQPLPDLKYWLSVEAANDTKIFIDKLLEKKHLLLNQTLLEQWVLTLCSLFHNSGDQTFSIPSAIERNYAAIFIIIPTEEFSDCQELAGAMYHFAHREGRKLRNVDAKEWMTSFIAQFNPEKIVDKAVEMLDAIPANPDQLAAHEYAQGKALQLLHGLGLHYELGANKALESIASLAATNNNPHIRALSYLLMGRLLSQPNLVRRRKGLRDLIQACIESIGGFADDLEKFWPADKPFPDYDSAQWDKTLEEICPDIYKKGEALIRLPEFWRQTITRWQFADMAQKTLQIENIGEMLAQTPHPGLGTGIWNQCADFMPSGTAPWDRQTAISVQSLLRFGLATALRNPGDAEKFWQSCKNLLVVPDIRPCVLSCMNQVATASGQDNKINEWKTASLDYFNTMDFPAAQNLNIGDIDMALDLLPHLNDAALWDKDAHILKIALGSCNLDKMQDATTEQKMSLGIKLIEKIAHYLNQMLGNEPLLRSIAPVILPMLATLEKQELSEAHSRIIRAIKLDWLQRYPAHQIFTRPTIVNRRLLAMRRQRRRAG